MADVTGNDILGYQGDANTALAGGGGPWGVMETPEFNQASRDLAIFSIQKNKALYDARQKDRDAVNKMIDNNALIPTGVLDTDRPRLDQKIQQFRDVYMKYKGDVMDNPERYREFVTAYQNAVGDIKQAQKKATGFTADMDLYKAAKNPIDQQRILQHMQQETSRLTGDNFYGNYRPYAPFSGIDLTKMGMGKVSDPEVISRPVPNGQGYERVTRQILNTDKMHDNIQQAYNNKDVTHMFTDPYNRDGLLDHMTPEYVDNINQQLKSFNAARVADGKDPIPELTVNDKPVDAAWKVAIAGNPYSVDTPKSDAAQNQYEIGKDRNSIAGQQANTAARRENTYEAVAGSTIRKNDATTGKIKASTTATTAGTQNVIDNISTGTVAAPGGGRIVGPQGQRLVMNMGKVQYADGTAYKGSNEVLVPLQSVGDEILTEYQKSAGTKKVGTSTVPLNKIAVNTNGNDGSKWVKVRLGTDGTIDGIMTEEGRYADRNQFEHITNKAAGKGATKNNPKTDLGEYDDDGSDSEDGSDVDNGSSTTTVKKVSIKGL